MDTLSLLRRVAIITGSSSGLGEATAILFAKRGARVTLHGRSEAKLESVRKRIVDIGTSPDNVLIVAGDITEAAIRKRLVEKTFEKFGKIDILVNNAGVVKFSFLRDLKEDDLDYHLNILLKSPVFMTQAALPYLVKSKGNVINISSISTDEPMSGLFANSSSKVALEHFSKIAAIEFGKSGLRVNTVSPGVILTPIFDSVFDKEGGKIARENFLAVQARKTVLGRNGSGEDIAESVAFLASDAANFITGSTIHVDGGRHIYPNSGDREVPDLSDLAVKE